MKNLLLKFENIANKGQSLALLFLRLILAYGFWEPAKTKWADIHSVAEWFGSIGIPAPVFNAYLVASTEMAGVFLLALGLVTRIISIPLMITMLVAIKKVHWQHGFAKADNGFEIPLYYLLMLFVLLTFGAGKISLDFLINGKRTRK
jgi:putative oxidoreductase